MKKVWKSLASMMLAAVMVITTVMTYLPSLEILAAPITKQMAHLKAGSGNGNGHFGGTTPEAFVLSDRADVTNDNFSFTLKVGSTQAETRFRFVNKYVDDNNWSFIAYDGASGWLYQYKVDGMEAWPNLTGLPPLNQNDVVEVSGSYGADGLSIIVIIRPQNSQEQRPPIMRHLCHWQCRGDRLALEPAHSGPSIQIFIFPM